MTTGRVASAAAHGALLERDEELASPDALIAGAAAGQGAPGARRGPGPDRQDRLVAEARAERGSRALTATKGELERDFVSRAHALQDNMVRALAGYRG